MNETAAQLSTVTRDQSAIGDRHSALPNIAVIIPAWNEEGSIGRVIADLPKAWVRQIIVADNNSTDYTADVARKFGATVIPAPHQGYGSACLAAFRYLESLYQEPDIVVFIDADYSDHPDQLPLLVEPIVSGQADFVLGSRMLTPQPPGAMLPQAIFGNKLACFLMRVLLGQTYTDLGPFRAISWQKLRSLNMTDTNFGWTVEMQIKAARHRLRIMEVPVAYRRRIGYSKITGTFSGTIRAGAKILWTIFWHGCARDGRANAAESSRPKPAPRASQAVRRCKPTTTDDRPASPR